MSEVVAELPTALPGEVNVIAEVPQSSVYAPLLALGLCDEAQVQVLLPPPRFVVMSTAGVLEVTQRRPLEILQVPPPLWRLASCQCAWMLFGWILFLTSFACSSVTAWIPSLTLFACRSCSCSLT